ncbi:MAG: sigma factor-like helix-turn-helix DNA-binding protein [Bryobacteraceae bacterium]
MTAGEYKCLRLRTEGLRYEEIAAKLNLSTGTVGTLLSRAVGKLRRTLIPAGGEGR